MEKRQRICDRCGVVYREWVVSPFSNDTVDGYYRKDEIHFYGAPEVQGASGLNGIYQLCPDCYRRAVRLMFTGE